MTKWLTIIMSLIPLTASASPFIASRTLPAGTVIELEHILIEDEVDQDLSEILGQQTRTVIYEGKPIHASRLHTPQLVNRNQLVVISYETPLMLIKTEGRALEAGQVGQVIRVMNISSKATVSGQISQDGTVRVMRK